jgi:hypothetical protein
MDNLRPSKSLRSIAVSGVLVEGTEASFDSLPFAQPGMSFAAIGGPFIGAVPMVQR